MTFITFFIGIIVGVVGTILFVFAAGWVGEEYTKKHGKSPGE